ncbi:hypothetical protein ZOSMA_46G00290 [Zostera marina]|uniref:Uncharacterized protein n=1 Tax=Zostera marina TaxID=29655 RepID=A0A0K9P052_ZOSMR|nr:hypothetical protein ZOSMA_46G00290 [Zostera marina]
MLPGGGGGGPRDVQNRENNSQKVHPLSLEETMNDGQSSMDALISEIFNNVSSLKTAYMQLQAAHTPYEPEKIQTADKLVIKELMKLSELKHTYRERYPKPTPSSPEDARLVVEIHEQQSLLKTYEVMVKKFQSQIQNSDSEIRQLEQQIQDAQKKKIRLEKKFRQKEMFSQDSKEIENDDSCFDGKLTFSLYFSTVNSVQKGIHDFSNALVKIMREAGCDIKAAAKIIQPTAGYTQNSHRKYAFHSYVCLKMLLGFQEESFLFQHDPSIRPSSSQDFFSQYKTIRTLDPLDMVSRNPISAFGTFCKMKYISVMHPKLEESMFGHLDQLEVVMSGGHPRTPFYLSFVKLAKQVWMLHRLTYSFDPKVEIFQVRKGTEFSEAYMENVVQHEVMEAQADANADASKKLTVAFMTMPGFVVKGTIIKSLVYLNNDAKCPKNI